MLNQIRNAIEMIEARLSKNEEEVSAQTNHGDAIESLNRGDEALRSARERLQLRLFKDAAAHCRQAVEGYCKAVLQSKGVKDSGSKTIDGLRLSLVGIDKQIAVESDRLLPCAIDTHIGVVQKYGNFGSHDQPDPTFNLSEEIVVGCLSAVESVAVWAKASVRG